MLKSILLDATKFERFTSVYRQQAPYAISVALNRTADDVNAALRLGLRQRFTIRQPGLLEHVAPTQLPAPNRATKTDLRVFLETERIGQLFNPFETGAPKFSQGGRPLIIPSDRTGPDGGAPLRPSKTTVIPRSLYPANLGLTARRDPAGKPYYALGRKAIAQGKTPVHRTAGGKIQVKGKRRTFALDPRYNPAIPARIAGIYQRTGPGKHDIRLLWHYADRVRRPAILEFYATAERVWNARIGPNVEGAFALAIGTAR